MGRGARRTAIALAATVAMGVAVAGAADPARAAVGAGGWTPDPAAYAVGEHANVPVTMSDGTVLRADVYFPTDPKTKQPADGPFPVIMTQTPYGKSSGLGAVSGAQAGLQTGGLTSFVQRGYIDVVADVRGTGDSHGTFGLFDPVQATDGAALVDWAAKLPHSNGKVGLYGPSYLGIDQIMTASRVGRHSPLKAIFPVVAGNDLYRDIVTMGGVPGFEFDAIFLGLTGTLNTVNPAVETLQGDHPDLADLIRVEVDHAGSLLSYQTAQALDIETGGGQAYDEAYWMARNPRTMLKRVVQNRIPAFLVGGWFDLFQRGEPLNYSGLQNAWAGRPVDAPMLPGQKVTGRYQLLMGPWYHVTAGEGLDVARVELEWFDTWLKGQKTGIQKTRTPLHVYRLGKGGYVDAKRYPLSSAKPTPYYLGAGGTLSPDKPTAAGGADQLSWVPASTPCDRQSDQWGAGAVALLAHSLGGENPCDQDDRSMQIGPGALSYTTKPLGADTVIAGPVDVTLYASSSRPESYFEATLEDVAPDGTSTPLTSGGLLGSFRALDAGESWLAPDGNPILPYHPYTKASAQPVPTDGSVSRFDLEVFPTVADVAQGHRIRVTITSADTPHLVPTPAQLLGLAGGVYQLQRNAAHASFVELPLAPESAFSRPCTTYCPKAPGS